MSLQEDITNSLRAARGVILALWLLLAWALIPSLVRADVLVATNDERFVGTVISQTADTVVFESELGGRITVPRIRIRELLLQPANPPAASLQRTNPPPPLVGQVSPLGPPNSTNSWTPPTAGHGPLDWIQLKSGSWLSGQFKYLQNRKLEFDNDELDEQTFKLKDILQIYPAKPAWARFDNRKEPVFGTIVVSNGLVTVSGAEQYVVPRDQLLGLTPSSSLGMKYWSGYLNAGLNLQSGNTKLATVSLSGELARRTPNTDLVLDYLGNYSKAKGIENANNQRVDVTYDVRLDRHWFVRPLQLEFYHDPPANISLRGTAMVGGGYYLFDRSGLTWNVAAGPAYQYTRFETVQPDQGDTTTTPAGVIQTFFKMDFTSRLTFSEKIQTIFTKEEAGEYTHHAVSTLEFKVKRHLDLDVSFIWDYLQNPKPESNEVMPLRSDLYLTVGLGYRF